MNPFAFTFDLCLLRAFTSYLHQQDRPVTVVGRDGFGPPTNRVQPGALLLSYLPVKSQHIVVHRKYRVAPSLFTFMGGCKVRLLQALLQVRVTDFGSPRWDSDPRPSASQTDALIPLSYEEI